MLVAKKNNDHFVNSFFEKPGLEKTEMTYMT